MERIKLFNRYKDDVYLEKVSPNVYKLVVPDKMKDFICCNYTGKWKGENFNIHSVDPSGGPYLCIGYRITDDEVVDHIELNENDFYLYSK